ncbi:ATPase AAA [Actinomycetota bacterium]|nr:ATPase AAA [Actinomycetota bacterium]
MTAYRRRILDDLLDDVLPDLPATELHGAKGIGKTATAQRRARSVLHLDDQGDRELLAADTGHLARLEGPVLLDEWQRMPAVWEVVRRDVDDRGDRGRYLLTGSAAPVDVSLHSGAGRIVSLRMRPLSLAERGIEEPTVSVAALLAGGAPVDGQTSVGLPEYVEEIVASGFPGIRAESPRVRALRLDGYLDAIIQREFAEQGLAVRRPQTLRAWLAAYAAATSTTASYNAILAAATPGEADKPAKTTTIAYRDVLTSLWMLDEVEAWLPTHNHLSRLGQAPKHYLADPALAARLLGVDAAGLLRVRGGTGGGHGDRGAGLRSGTLLGALFEHLVTLSMHSYAQAAEAGVHHLRTRNGDHEVDLVLQRGDGGVVAMEVKLASTVTDADVRHLHWLRERLGDELVDAVVVTTGEHAYRRADGVAVVPAALLGP